VNATATPFPEPVFAPAAAREAPRAEAAEPARAEPPPAPAPAPRLAAVVGAPAAPPAPGGSSLWLPAGVLVALAVAALVLARRRRAAAPNRLLEVVETASLGPRRSIVVARVADELLVLGASEAGITLLSSRPAPPAAAGATAAEPATAAAPPSAGAHLAGLLARLAPRPRRDAPAFDAALAESVEDLELRRKLAGGRTGIVP
jgi:flagellar biogenesis protein FliO